MNGVVSSRVRLARNCTDFAFSHRLAKLDAIKLLARSERVFRGLAAAKGGPFSALDGNSLERRFFSADGNNGAWVNHIDHFRIWSFQPGSALPECLRQARLIETELASSFPFTASLDWGYLSPELNNLGTAMRATLLLHLPALSRGLDSGTMAEALAGATDSAGLELRAWGSPGSLLYILANRETLGLNEGQLLNKLDAAAHVLLHYEDEQAKLWFNRSLDDFTDSAWRALGLLRNCRMITEDEAFRLLGQVRLGLTAGVFTATATGSITHSQLNAAVLIMSKAAGQIIVDPPKRADNLRTILA